MTSSNQWWAARHRLVLAVAVAVSLASWGLTVLIMSESWERVWGTCAGLTTATALSRSMKGELNSLSRRIPLLLFILVMPVFSGLYLSGIFDANWASALVFGLSILWLCSTRLHRGVGVAAFALTVCGLLIIPTDVILNRRYVKSPILVERCPTCPLVLRLPRARRFENARVTGELSSMSGISEFAETVDYQMTTDGKGFSLVSGSSEKRPYDIVLLGDSYAAHPAAKSWPGFLCRDTGLNIRNLAVPASGPWDGYMNLRLEYPELHLAPGAKVFWCLFSGNDLYDFYGPLPFEKVAKAPLFTRLRIISQNFRGHSRVWDAIRSSGVKDFIEAVVTARGSANIPPPVHADKVLPVDRPDGPRMLLLRHYVEGARKTQHEIEASPSFPALDATIRSMADFVHAKSLNLTVLVFPSKEEVYRWLAESGEAGKPWSTSATSTGFGLAIQGLCKKYALPCHDLTPAFVANSKSLFLTRGEMLWQRDDTHWNEKGHQLTARIVMEMIRKPE